MRHRRRHGRSRGKQTGLLRCGLIGGQSSSVALRTRLHDSGGRRGGRSRGHCWRAEGSHSKLPNGCLRGRERARRNPAASATALGERQELLGVFLSWSPVPPEFAEALEGFGSQSCERFTTTPCHKTHTHTHNSPHPTPNPTLAPTPTPTLHPATPYPVDPTPFPAKAFPELMIIIKGISSAMKAVVWSAILLVILTYTWATPGNVRAGEALL